MSVSKQHPCFWPAECTLSCEVQEPLLGVAEYLSSLIMSFLCQFLPVIPINSHMSTLPDPILFCSHLCKNSGFPAWVLQTLGARQLFAVGIGLKGSHIPFGQLLQSLTFPPPLGPLFPKQNLVFRPCVNQLFSDTSPQGPGQ